MKHPLRVSRVEPIGLLGVTEVTVNQYEPHVTAVCVCAPRPIYFAASTMLSSTEGKTFDFIERGDQGTGRLRLTLEEKHEGIFSIFFGQPCMTPLSSGPVYTTTTVMIGLDVEDLTGDRRVLWVAT